MRDYGKIYSSFWTSGNIRDLSDDGRMLALYLMSCPHGTISGVFRLPDGYACEDLQWTPERVKQGFAELFDNGFAKRCETTKWVWIIKHFEWNQPENPNQRKSAAKVAQSIPCQCSWKPEFMRASGELLGLDVSHYRNPCGTVAKPFANQEQEQQQEQQQEQEGFGAEGESSAELLPAVADATAAQAGGHVAETTLQANCRLTWAAYAAAYAERYGVPPVRNAKVSAAIKGVVQRIGGEEAPDVAAWFVSHPGDFYAKRMHDTGCLLADCEKLRTEWATGRVMTASKARQSDRTGGNAAALSDVLAKLEAKA